MGKLVRDLIPDIIRADGHEPDVRVLHDDDEYAQALLTKLVEEADEVMASSSEERLGELADVYEVVAALAATQGLSMSDVESAAQDKAVRRGRFNARLFLA